MTDLQALALAKSIRSSAWIVGVSMLLLGLMIWQPWASPKIERIQYTTVDRVPCAVYKNTVDCSIK